MKTLAVVRHGEYDGQTFRLNSEGKEQMRSTGRQLAQRYFGQNFVVLSSPEDRATESAQILCRALGIDPMSVRTEGSLGIYNGKFEFKEAESIIRQISHIDLVDKPEVILMVTHLEIVDLFPAIWARSRGFFCPLHAGTKNGVARIIDLTRRANFEIRP